MKLKENTLIFLKSLQHKGTFRVFLDGSAEAQSGKADIRCTAPFQSCWSLWLPPSPSCAPPEQAFTPSCSLLTPVTRAGTAPSPVSYE